MSEVRALSHIGKYVSPLSSHFAACLPRVPHIEMQSATDFAHWLHSEHGVFIMSSSGFVPGSIPQPPHIGQRVTEPSVAANPSGGGVCCEVVILFRPRVG